MSLFNFDLRNSRLVLAGAALALGGGLLGGGCSSVDLSTEAAFCQAVATADCSAALVQACYGATDTTLAADTNLCIAARSPISKCNPKGLSYHPDLAGACLTQHQAVYATSQIDGAAVASLRDACLPVFNKGNTQGSTCALDSDCDVVNLLRCVVHAGKGTCQSPVPVMAGESCTLAAAQCTDSNSRTDTLYCDTGNHCVAAGAGGDKCGAAQPCGTGLRCTATKLCASQLADSQPCHADGDCLGSFCLGANSAGTATGECAATLTFAQGGLACNAFKH